MNPVIEYGRNALGCGPSVDDESEAEDSTPDYTFDPFENEPVSEEQFQKERATVRGVFSDNEKVAELFESDEYRHLETPVSMGELEVLQNLDCYRDGTMDSREAIRFKREFPDEADLFVQVYDKDNEVFWVELKALVVSGDDVTNETIEAFAEQFRMCISTTFDPLANDHDEPVLYMHI